MHWFSASVSTATDAMPRVQHIALASVEVIWIFVIYATATNFSTKILPVYFQTGKLCRTFQSALQCRRMQLLVLLKYSWKLDSAEIWISISEPFSNLPSGENILIY